MGAVMKSFFVVLRMTVSALFEPGTSYSTLLMFVLFCVIMLMFLSRRYDADDDG